jgi:predicted nucleic acid-binding protein
VIDTPGPAHRCIADRFLAEIKTGKAEAMTWALARHDQTPGRQPGLAARGTPVDAMIIYLDASIVLRLVLGEPKPLVKRQQYSGAVTSALTEVECLRTLDRMARTGSLSPQEVADRRMACYRLLEEVEVVDISGAVLRRAPEPFPTPLGTLDAIHLSTAIAWRDAREVTLTMATHDKSLAIAARARGLEVVGV